MLIFIAAMIAMSFVQTAAAGPVLDIQAQLVVRHKHRQINFTITNTSSVPIRFDEAMSPCAPNELVTVLYIGEGGIGRFFERNPMISDSFSRNRILKPHQKYHCNFDISKWFYGNLPDNKDAILFWSFHPSILSVFKKSFYGGVFLLSK